MRCCYACSVRFIWHKGDILLVPQTPIFPEVGKGTRVSAGQSYLSIISHKGFTPRICYHRVLSLHKLSSCKFLVLTDTANGIPILGKFERAAGRAISRSALIVRPVVLSARVSQQCSLGSLQTLLSVYSLLGLRGFNIVFFLSTIELYWFWYVEFVEFMGTCRGLKVIFPRF